MKSESNGLLSLMVLRQFVVALAVQDVYSDCQTRE
jgi:hypothetical protein